MNRRKFLQTLIGVTAASAVPTIPFISENSYILGIDVAFQLDTMAIAFAQIQSNALSPAFLYMNAQDYLQLVEVSLCSV